MMLCDDRPQYRAMEVNRPGVAEEVNLDANRLHAPMGGAGGKRLRQGCVGRPEPMHKWIFPRWADPLT